jgi:hypothetical protein
MGSGLRGTHVGGALAIVGAALLLKSGILGNRGAQPLRYDHTRQWTYVQAPHRASTALERRLGDVAALVAARPVQVRCEDFSDGTPLEPGGVVQFNGKRPAEFARIRPDVCTMLLRFIRAPSGAYTCVTNRSCNTSVVLSARALTVLAHESVHLRGVRNEAMTQCYAMQTVARAARALGASAQDGRALAALEYAADYPHMPANYRSAECHPGGGLDLTPGTGWWRD